VREHRQVFLVVLLLLQVVPQVVKAILQFLLVRLLLVLLHPCLALLVLALLLVRQVLLVLLDVVVRVRWCDVQPRVVARFLPL
jgi:hypothetical protein